MCFGTALVVLDGSIATVALPTIARDLGVDAFFDQSKAPDVCRQQHGQLVAPTRAYKLDNLRGDLLIHRAFAQ